MVFHTNRHSYLYGGWNGVLGASSIAFDEIWVLSLPAFEWIQANYTAANPRHAHSCTTFGSQMLIVGGIDPSQTERGYSLEVELSSADNFAQGLAVLDLNTLKFSSQFDPRATAYEPIKAISDLYANGLNGPGQWASPALQAIFQYNTTSIQASNGKSGGSNSLRSY
jgi:hypothetical protein